MPEVPAVPERTGLKAARGRRRQRRPRRIGPPRCLRPDGPLARQPSTTSNRAADRQTMAAAVAHVLDARRRAAGRSRDGHRQDAGLSDSGDPQPAARARVDWHQEPSGTDLFQGPSGAARRARHPVHRNADEGPRQLPVPSPPRSADRRREPGGARRLPADHPGVVEADRDRRSRRARGSARGPAVLERSRGNRRHLPGRRVPAIRRLLTSRACASAPPRPTS